MENNYSITVAFGIDSILGFIKVNENPPSTDLTQSFPPQNASGSFQIIFNADSGGNKITVDYSLGDSDANSTVDIQDPSIYLVHLGTLDPVLSTQVTITKAKKKDSYSYEIAFPPCTINASS